MERDNLMLVNGSDNLGVVNGSDNWGVVNGAAIIRATNWGLTLRKFMQPGRQNSQTATWHVIRARDIRQLMRCYKAHSPFYLAAAFPENAGTRSDYSTLDFLGENTMFLFPLLQFQPSPPPLSCYCMIKMLDFPSYCQKNVIY